MLKIIKNDYTKIDRGVFLKKALFAVMFFLPNYVLSKVLILTFAHNKPDFIEIQHLTFNKFLTDDYEFVVFNDANESNIKRDIEAICCKYDIKCIPIPQEIHTYSYLPHEPGESLNHPTVRNVTVVQYALDTLGFAHNDILVLLDSDLFLTKQFSFRQFLKGYDLGGMCLGNGNVTYLWHGLAILDMSKLPDKETLTFNCGRVNNIPIDAGGHSYYFISKHPELKIHWIENYSHSSHFYCQKCKITNINNDFVCKHNDDIIKQRGFNDNDIQLLKTAPNIEIYQNFTFVHYRAGTNWENRPCDYHKVKMAALKAYISNILK